ncbi:MAG: DUF952 domain-containing protein [Nocardioidaceae bacterium]
MLIFHIANPADWEGAQHRGSYTTSTYGVPLAQQGFIHASRYDQIDDVLAYVYADVTEPQLLLVIDTDLLECPWQLDPVAGASTSYPHLYGALNPSAVIDTAPVERAASGAWRYNWAPPTANRTGP